MGTLISFFNDIITYIHRTFAIECNVVRTVYKQVAHVIYLRECMDFNDELKSV